MVLEEEQSSASYFLVMQVSSYKHLNYRKHPMAVSAAKGGHKIWETVTSFLISKFKEMHVQGMF